MNNAYIVFQETASSPEDAKKVLETITSHASNQNLTVVSHSIYVDHHRPYELYVSVICTK